MRRVTRGVTVVLVVAAIVLGVIVAVQVLGGRGRAAEPGEVVPLQVETSGRDVVVEVPGQQVQLHLGVAVDSLAAPLVEASGTGEDPVRAPGGGALLPLGFQVVVTEGTGSVTGPPPVGLALVAGDQRVELEPEEEASLPTVAAVAVADADAEAVVEVTFEGLTQRVDVRTGEIDAGAAAALYEPSRSLATGCSDALEACELTAVPGAQLRPYRASFTLDDVVLSPYSVETGWAEKGSQWALVRVFVLGADSVQSDRDYWFPREEQPAVTLDGATPVAGEVLGGGSRGFTGSLVFEVEDGTTPREVELTQLLRLPADAPLFSLPVSAVVALQQ